MTDMSTWTKEEKGDYVSLLQDVRYKAISPERLARLSSRVKDAATKLLCEIYRRQ